MTCTGGAIVRSTLSHTGVLNASVVDRLYKDVKLSVAAGVDLKTLKNASVGWGLLFG